MKYNKGDTIGMKGRDFRYKVLKAENGKYSVKMIGDIWNGRKLEFTQGAIDNEPAAYLYSIEQPKKSKKPKVPVGCQKVGKMIIALGSGDY